MSFFPQLPHKLCNGVYTWQRSSLCQPYDYGFPLTKTDPAISALECLTGLQNKTK